MNDAKRGPLRNESFLELICTVLLGSLLKTREVFNSLVSKTVIFSLLAPAVYLANNIFALDTPDIGRK